MKSRQREVCDAIAEALKEAFGPGGGVSVVVEDRCRPAAEVEKALGRLGVLALVSATEHRRRADTGAATDGDMSIEISLFENPKLNRRSGDDARHTVTSAAEVAANALHWRTAGGMLLVYSDMRRADADDGDYRMTVSFLAQPCSGRQASASSDQIEPEEVVEASLVTLLSDALPGWDVIGALAAARDGEMKRMPDTCVTVSADVASQDLDWTGPGIPCTYTVRVAVRCSNADDVTGETFRDACRTVRTALRALLGDGCAAMDGDGFACDSFVLGSTETQQDSSADSGGMRKTYTATVTGRFKPQQENDNG